MHATAEIEDILDANRRLGTVADLKTAIRKTREELDEFEAELDKGDDAKALSELGDTLLAPPAGGALRPREGGQQPLDGRGRGGRQGPQPPRGHRKARHRGHGAAGRGEDRQGAVPVAPAPLQGEAHRRPCAFLV